MAVLFPLILFVFYIYPFYSEQLYVVKFLIL